MNPAESNNPPNSEVLSEQNEPTESLNRQALAKANEGKYAESEDLYKQVITIYEKVEGPEHSKLSASLLQLAGVYFEDQKFIQSEVVCKRALALREKALGPDHPDVAESLVLYAKILRQKKFNYKAAQLEARAKTIRKKMEKAQKSGNNIQE
jgi:tetratricopeptide (TPR) repeat protein